MKEKTIILTKEIAPIQTKDRTLAVTPNLVFTTAKQFNRIFVEKESKISFDLNNFSEGKGENAKHFKFNLTLEQFYGILEALRSGYILFAKTKIEHFADYSMFPPEKDGIHKGEYKFRKFTLEYKNGKELWELLQNLLATGYEGIVITREDAPYQPGKRPSKDCLKVKKELQDTKRNKDFYPP